MACEMVSPVFLEYEAALAGFIRKKVKDPEEAKDILQSVYLKLYTHCDHLPQIRNVRSWVFQITRNAVFDYFREQSRRSPLPENDCQLGQELNDTFEKEILECVGPMIRKLPEMYAKPLEMSDLEGLPQKEVAHRLNLSLTATKSRIQRGRHQLRKLFTQCCSSELNQAGLKEK
jgi:RNA polymerase sigma-70 factor (ECF subfamily)